MGDELRDSLAADVTVGFDTAVQQGMQMIRISLKRMAEAACLPIDEREMSPMTYLRRSGLSKPIVDWVLSCPVTL
jgi:hypothetical protein